ncbi:MAG: hypothetical protein ACRC0A_04800 [Chitinophagaceae bacterium]
MKKFSKRFSNNNNKLWGMLLFWGIMGYCFLVYYDNHMDFSLLQSSLDGFFYTYYFLNNKQYPLIYQICSSPISIILFLLIELLLWYILFNDKKFQKYNNIRPPAIFLIFLLIGSIYVHQLSSFWIGQILVFSTIYLLNKNSNSTLLEMLFIALFVGIAGLFYAGCYLFLLILIIYAFNQKKILLYFLVGILGTLMPAYLAISYIWLRYDEWIYLPHLFTSWSWHTNIFPNIYLFLAFITTFLLGFVYLWLKQDTFKQLSKFLIGYYFISIILFCIEPNAKIAMSILIPSFSILFVRNNKN